jgi:hypothetical protein
MSEQTFNTNQIILKSKINLTCITNWISQIVISNFIRFIFDLLVLNYEKTIIAPGKSNNHKNNCSP